MLDAIAPQLLNGWLNATATPTTASTDSSPERLLQQQQQQLARLQLHLWGYAGTGLSLLGMAGNVISVRVLCSRRMRSSTSLYLAVQGCLDTVVLLLFNVCMSLPLVSPAFASLKQPNAPLIAALYPVSLFIHMCGMYVTTCFTVERCLSARFPIRTNGVCGRGRARRRLIAIGLFSLVYNAPRGLERMHFNVGNNATDGSGWSLMDSWWYRGIYSGVMYSLFMYVLPLALITVSNALLVHAIRRSTRQASQQQQHESRQHAKRLERDRSISRMLVGVVAVFVFCQTFALVDNLTAVALQTPPNVSSHWQQAFYVVAQFMIVVNASVNFILYCFFWTAISPRIAGHILRSQSRDWRRRRGRQNRPTGQRPRLAVPAPGRRRPQSQQQPKPGSERQPQSSLQRL